MSWLDTMRANHSDPADLRRVVAERLYTAHNKTRRNPLPGGFRFLALTERERWLRRADGVLKTQLHDALDTHEGERNLV